MAVMQLQSFCLETPLAFNSVPHHDGAHVFPRGAVGNGFFVSSDELDRVGSKPRLADDPLKRTSTLSPPWKSGTIICCGRISRPPVARAPSLGISESKRRGVGRPGALASKA